MNPYGVVHVETQREILKMATEYGVDMEKLKNHDTIWERVDSILRAKDAEDAQRISRQAIQKFQITGLVRGTRSTDPSTMVKQADKADNLADMLDKKGAHENAEKQRERAKSLRKASQSKTKGE